ncbi:NAD(P)-binding domain-containing protein [Mycolicibacterium sediminis]|uniref:Putative secreted protein n=1 Tax=Mycolicibacterium sediminis TaxID=1286180 RepID=A0A7I7QZ10_9MYCO|nr:NAD(P)-binding domain-containing protein [Mycolicibacterium sediminis]BBY31571.1 putative secreted protein [Mycolicibacterium sediminis]
MSELPVVVIGAGPLGLAAAAHLLERGFIPLVLEAGSNPAAAVEQWEHVRTFSPWPELVDPAAAKLLELTGWVAQESGFPTGREWIDGYLAPLAKAMGTGVRLGARVQAVSRLGRDRLVSPGRAETPFVVHVTNADGTECRVRARAVIDASGTWGQPNPAGADGVTAIGERTAAGSGVLTYVPPTIAQASGLAGKHVVVVGSGHSAMTAVIQLGEVVRKDPSMTVTWVLRRGVSEDTFGGGAADELPQRGALGVRSKEAVDAGRVSLSTGFRTERIDLVDGRAVLTAEDGRALAPADHVVVLTGFRPDLSFLSEMRIELDPILQAPVNLAGSIDPNMHSCGSVLPHGAEELAHPEPDLYIVGMKSYGRAPTFLAMTGYEQVRSIAAELAGDHEAARRVELALPDTGVCNGAGLFDSPDDENAGGGCCGPAPTSQPVSLQPVSLLLNPLGG